MSHTQIFRAIFYIFLCVLSPALAQGQIIKSFAVKAGASLANQQWKFRNMTPGNSKRYDKTGAFGGFELEFLKGKTLGLSTELSYCQKGYMQIIPVVTSDQPDGDGTYKTVHFGFNYFSISPCLTVAHETTNWSTYMGVGPRMDFFSNRTIDGRKASNMDMESSILGATVSGGLAYKLGNMSLFTELKFLYDAGKAIDNGFVEVKNRAAVLCFGFRERISR